MGPQATGSDSFDERFVPNVSFSPFNVPTLNDPLNTRLCSTKVNNVLETPSCGATEFDSSDCFGRGIGDQS